MGEINSQNSISVNIDSGDFLDYFDPVLLRFDAEGNEVWNLPFRPGFIIESIKVIDAGVLDTDEYVLMTGFDENNSDVNDPARTRIMLINSKGNLVGQFDEDFSQHMYDFTISNNYQNDLEIIAVGSFINGFDGFRYSGIFQFSINKTSKEIQKNRFIPVLKKHVVYRAIRKNPIKNNYLISGQMSCPEKITPRRRLKRRLPQAVFYHDSHSIRKKFLKIFFYAMEMWKKHTAK